MFTCVHYSVPIFDWLCLKIFTQVHPAIAGALVYFPSECGANAEIQIQSIEIVLFFAA